MLRNKTKLICLLIAISIVFGSLTALAANKDSEQGQSDDVIPTMQLEGVEIDFMRAGQWLWYVEGHKQ
jgi:hypothetical protein